VLAGSALPGPFRLGGGTGGSSAGGAGPGGRADRPADYAGLPERRRRRLRHVRAFMRSGRTRGRRGRCPARSGGLLVIDGAVGAGGDSARLASASFAGLRAGADRGCFFLGGPEVVEPAGLFLGHLFGLDGRSPTTPEQAPVPTGLLVALVSFVVGPIGTARSHGCSSPAAAPLSSTLPLSSAFGPSADEPPSFILGPSGAGPPPRTILRNRGNRSPTARSAP